MTQRCWLIVPVLCLAPAVSYGRSAGAPTQRVGIQAEGGLTCAVCHTTFGGPNTDPTGSLTIQVAPYTPGVKQKIRVQLSHPTAQRWGFELSPRLASDETKPAGTLEASDSDEQIKCGDAPGSNDCPAGAVQFATHNVAGTHQGTTGSTGWDLEWTPPATDVGQVIFYASGNAANGNGNNQGDHIYNLRLLVPSAGGCTLAANPTIAAVVNGASFQPGLGFDGMFTLFGSGFAPAGTKRSVGPQDFRGGRFPTEYSCVEVEVDGVEAPIVYIDEHQINAQVPARVVNGPVKVELTLNKGLSKQAKAEVSSVQMREAAPAFFLIGSSKSIAAQHADFTPVADSSVAQGGTPAKPGETITLYGTAFGVTNPVWQAGELPTGKAAVTKAVTVTVGGTTLRSEDVSYVGLSPQSISGLYQVNLRIPDSAADGNLPVVLRIGDGATQDSVTIPVKR